jgi:hypothetical protein
MSKLKVSLEDRLHAADLAIGGALADADVQSHLSAFNWDAQRIQQGKALYNTAQQLVQKQRAEYGDQYNATEALNAVWKEADAAYMRYLKVARVALKNDTGAWQKLDLNGERKQTLSGWLKQARQFYAGALGDATLLTKLGECGITLAKLTAGSAQVDSVEAASVTQAKERGEAQDATKARDAALESLDDWMSDFIAIARVALEDQPQLLEKLGIIAPS